MATATLERFGAHNRGLALPKPSRDLVRLHCHAATSNPLLRCIRTGSSAVDDTPDQPMTAAISSSYRFGQFELQPCERRLLVAGTPVRVGRHAFDVLTVLVERSGHLVTKDYLLECVWPNLVVEENTLQAHISALRKLLATGILAC